MKVLIEMQNAGAFPGRGCRRTFPWDAGILAVMLILPTVILLVNAAERISPPLLMWILAALQWLILKATFLLRTVSVRGGRTFRWLPYLLWVGMDTGPFLGRPCRRETGHRREVVSALCFATFGAGVGFVVWITRGDWPPIWTGAMVMVALLGCLHFGLFALLAVFLNRCGFPVRPIMNAPWKADCLTDFWGKRWNLAFRDWAHLFLFRPVCRRWGATAAMWAVFLFSGLIHELVISVPARGGWGLPTLYFLLQGGAVFLEKRWPLSVGKRRLFTWITVLLTAPILFHPPFLSRVLAPMF